MLKDLSYLDGITDFDREVFARLLPQDNALVQATKRIDWDSLGEIVSSYYCRDLGQPAYDPLRMLKLEFLKYRHMLSDRQVMERAITDLSFRYFLQVGHMFEPPHATCLCHFRGRLGAEGFRRVFDEMVAQAREAGLVKDRLRLKDARGSDTRLT